MNDSTTRNPDYSVSYSVLISEAVYRVVSSAEQLLLRLAK